MTCDGCGEPSSSVWLVRRRVQGAPVDKNLQRLAVQLRDRLKEHWRRSLGGQEAHCGPTCRYIDKWVHSWGVSLCWVCGMPHALARRQRPPADEQAAELEAWRLRGRAIAGEQVGGECARWVTAKVALRQGLFLNGICCGRDILDRQWTEGSVQGKIVGISVPAGAQERVLWVESAANNAAGPSVQSWSQRATAVTVCVQDLQAHFAACAGDDGGNKADGGNGDGDGDGGADGGG